jgi:hypothetical protein
VIWLAIAVVALIVFGVALYRRRERIARETLGPVPPPAGLDASSRNRTHAP